MQKLKVIPYENDDGKFLLLANDAIANNLLDGDKWEAHFTEIVKKLVNENDIVIDAGANFGHHTITLAKLVGNGGRVHSFEPQRIIYQQLCANVFYNGLTNVYTYQNGLGEIIEKVSLQQVDYFANWVNIGDTKVGENGENIEVVTLDSVGLKKADFIKLDVQGYEKKVLEGASELIKSARPLLFVEIEENHLRAFGLSSNDLIDYIKSLNYDIYRIENNYPCDHICFPIEKAQAVDLISQSQIFKLTKV